MTAAGLPFAFSRLLVRLGAFDRLGLLLLGDGSALLHASEEHWLIVDIRLLGNERVKLAAFGRREKGLFDDVSVSDPAPQPLEHVPALFGRFARPARFLVHRPEPLAGFGDRLLSAVRVEVGLESSIDRKRLEKSGIIFAWGIAHQRSNAPGVIDERP